VVCNVTTESLQQKIKLCICKEYVKQAPKSPSLKVEPTRQIMQLIHKVPMHIVPGHWRRADCTPNFDTAITYKSCTCCIYYTFC